MATLIDGYNLLHVTGVFSDAVGPGSVEKLHAALLDFLLVNMDPAEIPRTTVVFDARGRRAKTRRSLKYSEMTVYYSARTEDADHLLAELIDQHPSPRQLTVVSSDHQVQRSARRRRAKAVDSEVWYAEMMRLRKARRESPPANPDAKPIGVDSEHDAAWWLRQFAPELLAELAGDVPLPSPEPSPPAPPAPAAEPPVPPPAPARVDYGDLDVPFPPEYLAEIEREFLTRPEGKGPQRESPQRESP